MQLQVLFPPGYAAKATAARPTPPHAAAEIACLRGTRLQGSVQHPVHVLPSSSSSSSSRSSGSSSSRGVRDYCSNNPGRARRGSALRATSQAPYPLAPRPSSAGNGVYALMLVNALLFLLDNCLHVPGLTSLYLSHSHPAWFQWVTHQFCHANWSHLSNNLFFLLTFGRLVEETEGSLGIVFIYLICGGGAALASWLLSPANTVSLGASGSIFGLFAVSVLTRVSWNLRSLLESVVLGNFVVGQVLSELKSQMGGGMTAGGLQVSHLAHLGGAAAGVVLVLLLTRLPSGGEDGEGV